MASTVDSDLYSIRVQAFRLSEMVTVSKAEGAALTRTVNYEGPSERELLLHIVLSDEELERIVCSLEGGRTCTDGLFFGTALESRARISFLKPGQLKTIFSPWSTFISQSPPFTWTQLSRESDRNSPAQSRRWHSLPHLPRVLWLGNEKIIPICEQGQIHS